MAKPDNERPEDSEKRQKPKHLPKLERQKRKIIRDEDSKKELLVHEETGEVLYERSLPEAIPNRKYKPVEDPRTLGNWLIHLSTAGARFLFALTAHVDHGNKINGLPSRIAEDAGISSSAYYRGRTELIAQGVLRESGTLASLNPTIVWSGPYGLSDYQRPNAITAWYSDSISRKSAHLDPSLSDPAWYDGADWTGPQILAV